MLPSRELTLKMLPNGQTFPVQHMEMLETALDKHCPNTLASDTRYRYHMSKYSKRYRQVL